MVDLPVELLPSEMEDSKFFAHKHASLYARIILKNVFLSKGWNKTSENNLGKLRKALNCLSPPLHTAPPRRSGCRTSRRAAMWPPARTGAAAG